MKTTVRQHRLEDKHGRVMLKRIKIQVCRSIIFSIVLRPYKLFNEYLSFFTVVIDTTLCTKDEIDALNSLQNQLKDRERARQAQLAAQAQSPPPSTEMVTFIISH